MHPTRSSGAGSGISDTYTPEAAETLRFEEEIQSLMRDNLIQHGLESPPPVSGGGGSSFTALLGLPPSQAVELLHEVEPRNPPAGRGEMWRNTYPRDASFVELATRFSVCAVEDPAQSNSGERSPAKPKAEPEDYGDAVICPIPGQSPQRPGKRKDGGDRSKAKGGSAKRSRSAEEDTGGEKLSYVHVRARRGQATDSHSLAERARREKINARMKLLQELVPGCSKITGTALVLDEIINHVQSLQRQVEFLSMRLAAVTPRIDFCGLDSFLLAECGRVAVGNGRSGMVMGPPVVWSSDGGRQEQVWHGDTMQQQGAPAVCWERGDNAGTHGHAFIDPSLFVFDSHASVEKTLGANDALARMASKNSNKAPASRV